MQAQDTAKTGEEMACEYLKKQGYKIITRNFRTPMGEIDIIARKDKILHFFEVKTRTGFLDNPFEAINELKKKRIKKSANYFLAKAYKLKMPCLFGAIGINLGQGTPIIECIVDAFE